MDGNGSQTGDGLLIMFAGILTVLFFDFPLVPFVILLLSQGIFYPCNLDLIRLNLVAQIVRAAIFHQLRNNGNCLLKLCEQRLKNLNQFCVVIHQE